MNCWLIVENGKSRTLKGLEPICGEDFCEDCGDCLACYNWGCITGDGCRWVIEAEKKADGEIYVEKEPLQSWINRHTPGHEDFRDTREEQL